MADYTKTSWGQQQSNPAAPEGLQQLSGRTEQAWGLQQWVPESYAQSSQSWFGGQNNEGVNNGWEVDFWNKANSSYQEALEAAMKTGKATDFYNWFQRPGATGIATWADPAKNQRVGDVYENGQKLEGQNVFDVFGDETASQMIGKIIFDGPTQARMNRDSDPIGKWKSEVQRQTDEWTNDAQNALQAQEQQDKIFAEQKDLLANDTNTAGLATAAGIFTGAMTAGGLTAAGFSWTGPLAIAIGAATAIGTGIAGGVSAYLNRDQLTEVWARGNVMADKAVDQKYGRDTAFFQQLSSKGQLAVKVISPFQNAVQGLADVYYGGGGDAVEEFYATDEEGNRKAAGWVQGADIAAAFADSMLQFTNPVGATSYMLGTGASVAGQAGTGILSNAVYNDRTGEWDKLENMGETLSAIGAVGFDALSMGLGHGIYKSGVKGREFFGGAKATGEIPVVGKGVNKWLGGGRKEGARTPAPEGAPGVTKTTLNGVKFTFDDQGNVIRARASRALLLNPEEALKWVGTTWQARRSMVAGGAGALSATTNRIRAFQPNTFTGRFVSDKTQEKVNRLLGTHMPGPDDYYRAALEMAHNTRFADAVVNGWAEGVLEAASATFEPLSVSEDVNARDVFVAYAYGGAAGMGMSAASRLTGTSDAVIEEFRAKSLYMMRNKITDIDEADWKELWGKASKGERTRMAIATAPEAQKIADSMDAYRQLTTRSAANSTVGLSVLNNARWGAFEQLHDNSNPRIDSTRKLLGLGASGNTVEGVADAFDYKPNSGVQSAYQTLMDIQDIGKGFQLQIDHARNSIQHWKDVRDSSDPADRVHQNAVEKIQLYEDDLATFKDQMAVSKEFADSFLALYETFRQAPDWAAGMTILSDMNDLLDAAYEGRWKVKDDQGNLVLADSRTQELVRRAVELVLYRPPAMDDSSAILLRMQISPELTRMGEHSKTYIANMLLKAPNADHDGDQGIPMFGNYLDPTARQHLRRGGQYITPVDDYEQPVNDPNDPKFVPPMDNTPAQGKYGKGRVKVISDPQDGIKSFVDVISEAGLAPGSDRSMLIWQHLNSFAADMMARYSNGTGPIRVNDMVQLLEQFDSDLRKYGYKAQEKLLNGMFSLAHQELLLYSDRKNEGPEMLWVGWRVNLLVDNIQRGLARLAFAEQKPVIPGEAAQLPEEHAFNEGIAKRRATQDGMTIALLLDRTVSETRQAQALHYSPFVKAAVYSMERDETGFAPQAVLDWEEEFSNLGSGMTKSEVERIEGKNAVENRVVEWLADISAAAKRQYPNNPRFQNLSEALVTLGMMRVQDVEVNAVGEWKATGGEITLLQSLLKKSLWIEKNKERAAREDSPEQARIERLDRLTDAKGTRSVTASKALIEVMGNQSWHRLVGEESDYMGGVVTPNQTILGIQGLSDKRREAQIEKWERLPNYFRSNRGMNPPYTAEYLMSGNVNAFTMLIDAVAAVARTDPRDMERRNKTASDQWRGFHGDLKTMRQNWRKQHNDRLVQEWKDQGNKGAVSPEFVLRDMLAHSAEASVLIGDIIPEAAVRGIFSLIDGEVWTANWLEAMLLEENSAKAEVMYFLFNKLAELNVMGGQLTMPKDWDKDDAGKKLRGKALTEAKKNATLVREGVAYDQIKSRFLRKVYVLAKDDPTGYELNRLLILGLQSNDVHEFLRNVDAEPNWGQGEKRLLAYFDDVAGFEVDPKDFWSNNLPGALQREAITTAANRMARLSTAHAEMAAEEAAETQVLKAMKDLEDGRAAVKAGTTTVEPDSQLNASKNLAQVDKALALAKMFPDAYGIRARLQMMKLIQSGVIQTQDKGGPDPAAGPMGAPAATMDDFGFQAGLMQEYGWQNRHSWKDILTNPTKLVEGPVRIMFDDGRILDVDFSTRQGIVDMLQKPELRPLVKAALFPTVRDITDDNISRTFQVHQPFADNGQANIVQLLEEADLGHLFSSNGRLSLEQAERIIEMADAGVRAFARTATGAAQEMQDQPVQAGIHDLLVAYTHSPGADVTDKEEQRKRLIIDVAEALVGASTLSPAALEELKKEVAAYLQAKYMNDRRGYDILNMSNFDKGMLDLLWAQANLAVRVKEGNELAERARQLAQDPNVTQQQKDDLQKEVQANTDLIARLKNNPLTNPPPLPPNLQGAIDMATMSINDPVAGGYARMSALEYLDDHHRIDRFVDGDNYRLVQKVREIVNGDITQLTETDPALKRIPDEAWETIGHWVAYIYVAEAAGVGSSGQGIQDGKLGPEGEQVRRYWDHSWMYTTDMLFNPVVLQTVKSIRDAANYRPPVVSHMSVLDTLKRGMLNPKHLGQWTAAIVPESIKAQKVLQGASVLSAIQRHGINPPAQRDFVGAGLVSFELPKSEHMSDVYTPLPAGTGLDRALSTSPQWFIKLENHFYKEVHLLDGSGNIVADLSQVGDVVNYDLDEKKRSSTATSGYRVFSTLQMNEAIDKLRDADPALAARDDLVLHVNYVDVDKKPHTPQYVNSIYFDGVGPSRGTGVAPGVVADMIFGSSQINKKGQQDPLDFAARAGKAFMQGLTTPTEKTRQLVTSGASLQEIIATKAVRMWTKSYETGDMPWGSLTGLYKHMKMRHILRGTVNGKLTFMWSEEAITKLSNNEPLGFDQDEYQLVELSGDVLITLLGRSGKLGTQALTMPTLNLKDIDTFPSLDLDRMRTLGLIDLGLDADILNTPLAQMTNLPRQTMKLERDAEDKTTPYEERILFWHGQSPESLGNRAYMSKVNTNFHVPTSNAEHLRQLEWMLSQENLAPLLARFGIPFADINDLDKLQMTKVLMQMLQPVFERNANAMVWRFSMDMSPDPSAAVLAPMSLEKDFDSVAINGQTIAPVYGDAVIFDLAEIVAKNGGDIEAALKQAKGFITKLSKRGVTVVLASSSGDQYVRSQLGRWMREGELGYRMVAGSPHVFAPRTRDPQQSTMVEAQESGLLETRFFRPEGLGLRAITDMFGGSENTVYFDPERAEHIVWERISNTLVPGNIVATSAEQQPRLFNLPEIGEGQRDYFAKAAHTLRPLIETQEGREYLKKQLGGNPDGVRISYKHSKKDGSTLIDPGVMDIDEAIDEFIQAIQAGSEIIKPGAVLRAGQIYHVVNAQGEVVLIRHGFQLPKGKKLLRQFGDPLPNTDVPLKVAFSTGELEDKQSITPPLRIDNIQNLGELGIQVTGTYALDKMSKELAAELGYKAGFAPLPGNFQFHPIGMSQHVTISTVAGMKSVASKQSTNGLIIGYREAFALSGIDFRAPLVRFFFGDRNRTEKEFDEDWNKVARFLDEWSAMGWNMRPADIRSWLGMRGVFSMAGQEINSIMDKYTVGWQPVDFSKQVESYPTEPDARIAEVVLTTLMASEIKPEHIIGTRGLLTMDPNSSGQIAFMPRLFTEALSDSHYPDVKKMLHDQINSHMPRDSVGRPIYELTPDWKFKVRMVNKRNKDAQGTKADDDMLVDMMLQIYMGIPSESNSAALNITNNRAKADVSAHLAATFGETLQSWTAVQPTDKVTKLESLLGGKDEILRFDDTDNAVFWDLFRRMKKVDDSYTKWTSRRLPLQQAWIREADEKRKGYEVVLDKDGWDMDAYNTAIDKFFKVLNLDLLPGNNRYEADFLVRQFLGRPNDKDNVEIGKIDEKTFHEVMGLMTENAAAPKFLHPLHGGMVPMESESFWSKVYQAQATAAKPWQPMSGQNWRGKKDFANTWDEWVSTLLGQVTRSNQEFVAMYRKDLDGFWHTYHNTTTTFAHISLSLDARINMGLMDSEMNEYILSLDPSQNAMWKDPVIIEIMGNTLDTLTGHPGNVVRLEDARTAPVAEYSDQLNRIKYWLKHNKMGKQEDKSIASYFREGAYYQETTRQQSALWANLNNLQLLNRLFNPEIAASSVVELAMRNAMEHTTNLVMGTYTGKGGRLLGQGVEDKEGAIAGVRSKWGAKFSTDELRSLDDLAETLAGSTKWRAEIFGEIMYKAGVLRGAPGARSRKLERMAAVVAKGVSDPTIGMLPKSMAKRYLDAAWEYMSAIDQNITVEQFVKEMKENTLWLKENSPEGRMNGHKAGVNRVAQARSAKQSAISKNAFKTIDKLSTSSSNMAQFGAFLLNIPFYFRRFNINSALSLTGLTGFDQVAAMMLDARPADSIRGRLQSGMRGDQEGYIPNGYTDYSDVLEGVDLTRPFVRGAITQTGLMLAGLMAGQLSLDGEDDEAKKRRRMAQYLNVPLYLDPLRAENDYLYADALFLDSIDGLASIFKDEETGRSAILPPWYLRQFTSPMMGVQRFFNTGDLREIFWGFQDAASVIPYSAMNIWREANETVDLLAADAAANVAEGDGNPETRAQTAGFLTTVVMVLENALFNNSFVSGVRNSADEFDRDPWKYAATAEENTGQLDRTQGTQLTQQSGALGSYYEPSEIDPETGEVKVAYLQRPDDWSLQGGNLHSIAENNATAALLLSIFSGQIFSPDTNTFKRSNMVIKERAVDLPAITEDAAKAHIMAAFHGQGGQRLVTEQELIGMLKYQDELAGKRWNQADIEKRAAAILASSTPEMGGMSIMSEGEIGEAITAPGAKAVVNGLWMGTVEFESASLRGLWIPYEMREQLQEEMIQELITEGVNLGLSHEGAYWRAKRIWEGDKSDSDAPGMGDLLWSDEIPYYGKTKYNQLNTTYMIGPNGQPVATPFQRKSLAAVFGIPVPTVTHNATIGMTKDTLGKSVDEVIGINTGLHGLARKQNPVKVEPPKFPDLADTDGDPKKYTPFRKFTPFKRFGGGGGGGGGGGPYFREMRPLPQGTSARLFGPQTINVNNPQIRRANVRRERITSERGRLKQWQ